jgi:Holliday junction resolvase RusA-like endonuclease
MVNAERAQHVEKLSFWLPFPPSTNNLFAHAQVGGRIRRFPTKTYKNWRREAVIRIRSQRLPQCTAPVVVKLELTPRDGRARDADNYAKPVLDALVEAGLLIDDSNRYVRAVIPYWLSPHRNSGVNVTIRLAGEEPLRPGEARQMPLAIG